MRTICSLIIVLAFIMSNVSSRASEKKRDIFKSIFISPEKSASDHCHNGIANYRVTKWLEAKNEKLDAFASVEEILKSVNKPFSVVKKLKEQNCNEVYLWKFIVCTSLDDPKAPHIVPLGVYAATDQEMLLVMQQCFAKLKNENVKIIKKK